MNVIDIKNHRAWLKDLRSDRTHTAWLGDFDGENLAMEIVGLHQIAEGEQWICSVNRNNASNQFLLRIVQVEGRRVESVLCSAIHQSDCKGDARIRSAFILTIKFGEEEIQGRVVDVSTRGIGFISINAIEPGVVVHCHAMLDDEEENKIDLSGRIVHCSPNADGEGYRVGIALDAMNRLDEARWLVYLADGEHIILQARRAS